MVETKNWLVVSTHLKKIGQKSNGNIPQIGINIKKALKPPPRKPMDSIGTDAADESIFVFSENNLQSSNSWLKRPNVMDWSLGV